MGWVHPKLRRAEPVPAVLVLAPEPEPGFTNAQILDQFLGVPDEEWPRTLLEHPSLAGVIREELDRLRSEREEMIRIMRDTLEALQ